jgi:hypothetical protein
MTSIRPRSINAQITPATSAPRSRVTASTEPTSTRTIASALKARSSRHDDNAVLPLLARRWRGFLTAHLVVARHALTSTFTTDGDQSQAHGVAQQGVTARVMT